MNCIWILLLLCCCGKGNGCAGNRCEWNDNVFDDTCDCDCDNAFDNSGDNTCDNGYDNACNQNCKPGCNNFGKDEVYAGNDYFMKPPRMNYAGKGRDDGGCDHNYDRRDDYYDRRDCRCETCGCEVE